MSTPKHDDFRGARIDEFAADTPYLAAGWRWFAEHWGWTERDTEVAQLVEIGLEEKRIASALKISAATVHTHIKSLYDKTKYAQPRRVHEQARQTLSGAFPKQARG